VKSGPGAGPELSRDELIRYARHLTLPGVGEEGQRRLKNARVLCVGAGGLGSPLSLYLAAAGVGTLGIVDFDEVDATNLQRQILHGTGDVGRPKTVSAAERLAEVNPEVEVVRHEARLSSENALELLAPYDVVVDGTDNFPTRYLVNDACVLLGKPNVYGSVFRWEGQLSLFGAPAGWRKRFPDAQDGPERGPCYRCLFRQPPTPDLVQSCAEGGVLGVLPGVLGSLQAMETIKWILGMGRPMVGRLQIFDAATVEWREISVRRNPECPVCGDHPSVTGLVDYELFCGLSAVEEEVGEAEGIRQLGAGEVAERLAGEEPPLLVDVREPWEWRIGNLAERGAVLVPVGQLEERMDELPRDRELIMVCRVGERSQEAAKRLRDRGFPAVRNLRGGLVAWRREVDPGVYVV
jgi:adenylyltransferase/sulfurtransferase